MHLYTVEGIIIGRMTHHTCRICNSVQREEIEQMLGQNLQYRVIANKFLSTFDCDLHLLEQSIANHRKHIRKALTQQEQEFLKKLEGGEVSLEQASRLVAVKVFKKMLQYPDDFRFIDFFRTELLKIKAEENKMNDNWGKELVMRVFAGKPPPLICPHCKKPTVSDSPNLITSNAN